MPLRFLRFPELAARGIPWTRVHIYRLEKAGKFPKRVHIGDHTVAWVESEIDAVVADRMAAREKVAA